MFADHDATVIAIAVAGVAPIPAMVPAAVVLIDPDAGPVIAVAIISVVAADVDTKTLRVGDSGSADRKRRCSRKCVSELSHVFLLSLGVTTNDVARSLQEQARNFLE
jgi:hypothetical protein